MAAKKDSKKAPEAPSEVNPHEATSQVSDEKFQVDTSKPVKVDGATQTQDTSLVPAPFPGDEHAKKVEDLIGDLTRARDEAKHDLERAVYVRAIESLNELKTANRTGKINEPLADSDIAISADWLRRDQRGVELVEQQKAQARAGMHPRDDDK